MEAKWVDEEQDVMHVGGWEEREAEADGAEHKKGGGWGGLKVEEGGYRMDFVAGGGRYFGPPGENWRELAYADKAHTHTSTQIQPLYVYIYVYI
jgi:hypothetical protein